MILWRKMARDMRGNIGSYLAALILVCIGIVTYLSFAIARDNMVLAKKNLYQDQNFADGFAELVAMPAHYLHRIRRLPDISQVTGRLIHDVQIHDPDRAEGIYLRLVSLDMREADRLNDVRLLDGEALVAGEPNIWIDQRFYDENHLAPGQTLEIIAGGRARELTVMGKAISPEFVYPLRTDADIMPNPEHFGIAFVPQKIMWLLFPDYDRTYNSVAFSLAPKANFEYLRERLEVDLDRYGVIDIYPRADQTSHFILLQEIEAITTIVRFFPIITLVTAGFISYIVLKRMVEHQRQQIGVLKAFGYSRRHIMLHYISYSLSLAAAGGMAGGLLGMWLATPITSLLYHFFHLPPVYMGFSWRHLGISMLICFGILGFAGYQGCKAVLRLTPVEAMGPPAPAHGKHSRLEALPLLTSMLTVQGRMALRNLSRSRSRTAFVFFGLMSGCALVAFTWALAFEAMPKFMFYQYEEVQAHDAKVSLGEPRPRQQAIRELERRAEVSRAEPMAEVPVTLRHRWRRENVVLMGILPEARLYNILDVKGRRIRPGDDGLIISERLAYKLGARVGDTLQLESIYLRDPDNEVDVDVVAIVPQYIGMNAYTGISGLERMLRQAPFATSFLVEFGDGPVDDMAFRMRREYRDSDLITGVDTRMEQVRLMTDYWDEVGAVMIIFVAIGVVFSFAIIYVSGIVIFSERRRELASMRVLGMSITEVLGVITFEQWFIAFFAIIAGIPAARLIMRAFARGYSTDMYSMPAEISAGSLLAGVLITALSIWTAQRFAGRWVRRLSLAGALKTPE